MKTGKLLGLVAVSSILALTGCSLSEEESHYSGLVEARKILIQSDKAGLLKDIHLEEGADVKEGDSLISLQTERIDLEIESAKAGVEIAKSKKEEADDMEDDQIIKQAENALKQAENQLAILELEKQKMSVVSPVKGMIQDIHITEGELANPGQTLVTIIDETEKTLKVYIAEQDFSLIEKGKEVSILTSAYPDKTFKGTIIHIATEAEFTPKNIQTKEERAKRVFAVTIDVSNIKELKPGMTADVDL
ncbi:HlyD family secretion protein [Bacillus weihaiensis]|uniref:HlyD family secretion protein n=1 Tax=Bacillus weihaiensis TaxID=1547283 RepID=UPI002357C4B6|nr:efflux RND transporter periplasmic adaptor subunit [Bacillus weihaiensis]